MNALRWIGLAGLLSLVGSALAFQDLTLNGLPAVTVVRGEPVLMAGFFSAPGETATVRTYYDLNNNATLDASDPLLSLGWMWDGSWQDLDETVNGAIQDTIETASIPPGTYFLKVTDAGGSAQATLMVTDLQEGILVTGAVALPPATPGLLVFLLPADSNQQLPPLNAFTNHLGVFTLRVPESYAGTRWIPVVFDLLVQAPSYVSPLTFEDTVVITAPTTTVNLAMSPSDGTQILGTLQDDAGAPVPLDSLQVFAVGMYTNLVDTSMALAFGRVYGGSFTLQVKGPIAFYQVAMQSAEAFVPRYLAPGPQMAMLTGTGQAEVTLTAYRTNATITGHVYWNEDQPADNILLRGEGYALGSPFVAGQTYTGTYSDGHYEMWVSSELSEYRVSVDPASVPDSFYVQEGVQVVGPGATGVDFHLYPLAVEEQGTPRPSLEVHWTQGVVRHELAFTLTLPEAQTLRFELYDAAGRRRARLGEQRFSRGEHAVRLPLPAALPGGTYFLVVRNDHRTLGTYRFVKF